MAKEIPLTQGKTAIVDDADYDWINQWKWIAHRDGKKWYADRTENGLLGPKTIKMHRLILGNTSKETDHINGNGLDNRRSNLRECSTSENQRNKSKRDSNTSGYKGVSFNKFAKKFHAQIRVNGRRIHLGYFRTAEEAAIAYDDAAKIYHGNFANVNGINSRPQQAAERTE
jgi:hypothetical protein